jgi:hypothetical protein
VEGRGKGDSLSPLVSLRSVSELETGSCMQILEIIRNQEEVSGLFSESQCCRGKFSRHDSNKASSADFHS